MASVYSVSMTARELQILGLIAEGGTAREVGLQLGIAHCTVERHIENARLKTRTRNRAHMIAVAISRGWI